MYETHIFLDFEMNPIPRDFREAREIARAEIVEIGAVKLDREYRLVDRYSRFVKPEYGPIQPHITRLTGITDADVADAKRLGFSGTPYFLVDNMVIRGALPLENFIDAVELALKQ